MEIFTSLRISSRPGIFLHSLLLHNEMVAKHTPQLKKNAKNVFLEYSKFKKIKQCLREYLIGKEIVGLKNSRLNF